MKKIDLANLWLVGEGDLSMSLRKLVKDLDLENKVIFKGYVKPSELPKITNEATFGINLLENKSLNYYYSLANKTFDYIQAEIPAIHMNFPEYQKLNQSYNVSILVDNLDAAEIADSINKLLENNELYLKFVENCKKAKRIYIWEVEEQKLLDFYKKLFKTESAL